MIQKLRNIKHKIVAARWLLTHRNHYLLSFNKVGGRSLESYNVKMKEFIYCVQKRHNFPTYHKIIQRLKNIGTLTDDTLVREEIRNLIQELKKYEETMYE